MCQPCLCIFCVSDALRPRGFADPGGTTRSADSWAWKPPRVSYANLSIQMESDSQPNPLLFSGSLRPGHHPPVLISAGQVRTSGAALAAQSSEAASVPFGARNGGSVSYLPPRSRAVQPLLLAHTVEVRGASLSLRVQTAGETQRHTQTWVAYGRSGTHRRLHGALTVFGDGAELPSLQTVSRVTCAEQTPSPDPETKEATVQSQPHDPTQPKAQRQRLVLH